MKKILIPADLSNLSDYAYDLAHKIGQKTNTEIHILSIVPAPTGAFFDQQGNIKEDGGEDFSEYYQKKEDLENHLNRWLEGKEDVKFQTVKIGRIKEDVLQYAKEKNIDLIVMGTTGADGTKQFIVGSHTGNLAMESPVPILSLKCDRSDMVIKDLLLACDFHHPEEIDLTIVKSIQEAFSARLNLLKINTPKDFEPQRQVIQHMKEFAELNKLEQVDYHVYCDENVEQGVVNFSIDTGIDFVTLGTHQRSSLSQLFRKSISNDLVNHLWQPVLTFPIRNAKK